MKRITTLMQWAVVSAVLYTLPMNMYATEYYYAYNTQHQGYSVTAGHDPNSIVSAGSTCQTPLDCKILVQATDQSSGAVLWTRE
ncbi:MAG: hypothetical protein H3C64_06190 [Candidatus Kuenenia stuttgartiensis]|nr:hypothetical protein [Candidatus Kuenenia stuttgartiensis]